MSKRAGGKISRTKKIVAVLLIIFCSLLVLITVLRIFTVGLTQDLNEITLFSTIFGILCTMIGWIYSLTKETTSTLSNSTPPKKQLSQKKKEAQKNINQDHIPYLENFYGREKELRDLTHWIVNEHCREIFLLGIGGIGKTSLAVNLIEQIKGNFIHVWWYSLENAPFFRNFLEEGINVLSDQQHIQFPEEEEKLINVLIYYMQKKRCLIVLDNYESILLSGHVSGQYRNDYEAYGRFIKKIGEINHQSCLLITSREGPTEIFHVTGERLPVRIYRLLGLEDLACKKILQDKGFTLNESSALELIKFYSGNPLALKLAAVPIITLFQGDIHEFLKEREVDMGMYDLLNQQFNRLSPVEQAIIYWFAIERKPTSLQEIRQNIVPSTSKRVISAALTSLQQRSLIEVSKTNRFSLQAVIAEYVINQFIQHIYENIQTTSLDYFDHFALTKAHSEEHIRVAQKLLIITPLIEKLFENESRSSVEQKIKLLLDKIHQNGQQSTGYGAANVLNLLIYLQSRLSVYDFSHLTIRQAYLQGIDLHEVDFSHANFLSCLFTESFGSIFSLACSPNGELIAAGTFNTEVRIWQSQSGMPLCNLKGHTNWVRAIAFSPDNQIIASGSEDLTIRLWNVYDGNTLKILKGHTDRIRSVTFSPDGKLLASGSEDQTIRVWDINNGQCLNILHGHSDRVQSVLFVSDGNTLISGSKDQTIRFWDINTGKCTQIIKGHNDWILTLALSPDGKTLASAGRDKIVYLWDINNGKCIKTFQGHIDSIWSIAFNSDGSFLASASQDQNIRIWDTGGNKCIKALIGHKGVVWSLVFNPYTDTLISGSQDQTIRFWNINSGQCQRILQGHTNLIWSTAFSPDGKTLVSGNEDQTIRFWNISSTQCFKILHGHTHRVRSVIFSPDGQKIASASEDHTIQLWDANSGQHLKTFQGHDSWIYSIAFASDGRQLVSSGGEDLTVRVWDIDQTQCVAVLEGHTSWVLTVAYSPVEDIIASGAQDQTIRIWDIKSKKCIRVLTASTGRVWSLSFSADGQTLISGNEDGNLYLWNVKTGQLLESFQGHTDSVRAVSFTKDKNKVISGGRDKSVRIWDIKSKKCILMPNEHIDKVRTVSVGPDKYIVASGGEDGLIKIWDIQKRKCLKTLKSDRPYERMNITAIQGITEEQKNTLLYLGALDESAEKNT